jgi:hypothetical protein
MRRNCQLIKGRVVWEIFQGLGVTNLTFQTPSQDGDLADGSKHEKWYWR